MRPVCTILALTVALPVAAAAVAATSLEGTFGYSHAVGMMGYQNEKDCVADQGKWEDGLCIIDGEDTVAVKKDGDAYKVTISTVTTNAHTCDYETTGQLISPREIVASADTQKYVDDGNGKYHFEQSKCRVQLSFSEDENTVGVKMLSAYDECQDFCGANAGLDIEKAKRK